MKGTVRLGNACVNEAEKETIEVVKFLITLSDQMKQGRTFKDIGSANSNIISALNLKVFNHILTLLIERILKTKRSS